MTALYSPEFASRLRTLAEEGVDAYRNEEPFPHTVVDDFLPERVAEAALEAFSRTRGLRWRQYERREEVKRELSRAEALPPVLRELLHFFNSAVILEFLERLTGITALIPDPYFAGGGLHEIEPGGWLDIHADFNNYERLRLDRRLNLLLYLNRDWSDEYGGHLELWDRGMTQCIKKILPVFNRCVVFNTTDDAFHGHPTPLRCPAGSTRKSLALYYYTNGRPEREQAPSHSTLWQRRPGSDTAAGRRAWHATKGFLLLCTPPILLQAYEYLRGSRE